MARGFLYNNKDYTFPKGKLIESPEEFDAMLASGEWLESRGVPSGVPLEAEETGKTGEGGEEEEQGSTEVKALYEMEKDELVDHAHKEWGLNLDARKSLANLQDDVTAYLENKDGE